MNKNETLKKQICEQLQAILDLKVDVAMKAIASAKESRDDDTKSSAGDKYETGRAMMHIEMEKNEAQLIYARKLKNDLSLINIKKEYNKVEFGSLVLTNLGNYFISVGLGEFELNTDYYYAISFASPIGKLLKDKIVGDKATFQGREFILLDII